MELLLSNPGRRKRRRKSKTTTKRRKAKRRIVRRRRRRVSTRKVPTMARKRTTRRRSRRRTTTRRRRSSAPARRGFIDTNLLTAGAAVGAGLIVAPMVANYLPASFRSNQYGVPLAKIAGGLVAAVAAKRFNKTLGYSFAAGMIGSGVLDIVGPMLSRGGAAPSSLRGYEGAIVSSDLGSYELAPGVEVEGYLTDQGEVVDPDTGGVVGMLDLDEDVQGYE